MNIIQSRLVCGLVMWAVFFAILYLGGCQTGARCNDNCIIVMDDNDQNRGNNSPPVLNPVNEGDIEAPGFL